MKPIPETVEALRELTRLGDESIARTLLRISRDVERIVPEIVGISLSIKGDLTFTMSASHGTVAELDGVQYLAGGPCEETLDTGEAHSFNQSDPIDEDRWRLFARATAAAGIGSTLSLPVLDGGRVVAGINLYGSTHDAFEGHRQELAKVCGAWMDGAVTNADLGFTTRFSASATPTRLRNENLVDQAVGVLMAEWWISAEEAERRLRTSAQRAGISDAQMARALLGISLPRAASDGLADDFD
jgi:GAF domain-containing protein